MHTIIPLFFQPWDETLFLYLFIAVSSVQKSLHVVSYQVSNPGLPNSSLVLYNHFPMLHLYLATPRRALISYVHRILVLLHPSLAAPDAV